MKVCFDVGTIGTLSKISEKFEVCAHYSDPADARDTEYTNKGYNLGNHLMHAQARTISKIFDAYVKKYRSEKDGAVPTYEQLNADLQLGLSFPGIGQLTMSDKDSNGKLDSFVLFIPEGNFTLMFDSVDLKAPGHSLVRNVIAGINMGIEKAIEQQLKMIIDDAQDSK